MLENPSPEPAGSSWPLWATTPPWEVRNVLPREEWEPFGEAEGQCFTCLSQHLTATLLGQQELDPVRPAEPPYFFYCQSCMERMRKKGGPPKTFRRRDLGLCAQCVGPAEPNPQTIDDPVEVCRVAEARGMTVARLSTLRHCRACTSKSPSRNSKQVQGKPGQASRRQPWMTVPR